jgi:hypothetical protein
MPRLTLYTPELAERLCDRLEAGEPLASICRDDTMPGLRTVLYWADSNEEFGACQRHWNIPQKWRCKIPHFAI